DYPRESVSICGSIAVFGSELCVPPFVAKDGSSQRARGAGCRRAPCSSLCVLRDFATLRLCVKTPKSACRRQQGGRGEGRRGCRRSRGERLVLFPHSRSPGPS